MICAKCIGKLPRKRCQSCYRWWLVRLLRKQRAAAVVAGHRRGIGRAA